MTRTIHQMSSYGISLLSGGLDSTTVTAYAKTQVKHLTALTFYYGQTHSKEVQCAKDVATILGVEHRLLDLSILGEVAWFSSLTNPQLFPIPHGRSQRELGFGIPITYVPLRNTIFLALSAALLESQVLHDIEFAGMRFQKVKPYLFMAPNAIDYSGYPDCRPEYFEQAKRTLQYGSKLWAQYQIGIEIETPIIHMSKAEIVELGIKMKVPLEYTWSCYEGGHLPCSSCDSCILRAKGFAEAGIPDPLLVRLGATKHTASTNGNDQQN